LVLSNSQQLPFQQILEALSCSTIILIEEANSFILLLLWNMADNIVTSSNSSTASLNPTRIICHVCQKQFSQYTCPRCNSRYCSLQCYKVCKCTSSYLLVLVCSICYVFNYWLLLTCFFLFTVVNFDHFRVVILAVP